jgi:hypothetical protein
MLCKSACYKCGTLFSQKGRLSPDRAQSFSTQLPGTQGSKNELKLSYKCAELDKRERKETLRELVAASITLENF